MDEDKGWLKEVLKDVNEDVKAWPKWLKDEDSEARIHGHHVNDANPESDTNAKKMNFD